MLKQFIEANRQTGSTQALIENIIDGGGYLVVANQAARHIILTRHPQLQDQILTIEEIQVGKARGISNSRVFFDTPVLMSYSLVENSPLVQENIDKFECRNLHHIAHPEATEALNEEKGSRDSKEFQINVKLTEKDNSEIQAINKAIFAGEASGSMLGRLLMKKGMEFYSAIRKF